MIERSIKTQVTEALNTGKIIHIPGPRQVGKTTLLKQLEPFLQKPILWLNGDETDIRAMLEKPTSTLLKKLIGNHKTLIIDEAQRIYDIGIVLKLIIDNISNVKVIVTGSSAFELANRINEPLTGRKIDYFLFPLSFTEMVENTNLLEESRLLEHRLVYGYYPEVVTSSESEKEVLKRLSDAYLYKDIFAIEYLKKPVIIEKLLQALAFQIGNEVSYTELSQLIGADKETIERYIRYLEQAYIIYRLDSYSKNLRNEIKRGKKIYFYDNGIRNAIIRNFNPLTLRQDTGALWENFLITERLKRNQYEGKWINKYFWRTMAQHEIDYIEETEGVLYAFEFKWNPKRQVSLPEIFKKAYPDSVFQSINKENYQDFIYGF